MQYDVVISPLFTLQWRLRLLHDTLLWQLRHRVDLRFFDVWNGYWFGPKPTARKFLLLRSCSNLAVLLAFDAVWSRNLTLIMCCLNTLQ